MTLDTDLWSSLADKLQAFHQANKPHNKGWSVGAWSATTPFYFDYSFYNHADYDSMWSMNIDLHDAMGQYWQSIEGDQQRLISFAKWIVVEWGAISGNNESTLAGYCASIAQLTPLDGRDGVASYSKILSAKNRYRYFILDSRVAFSLNVLQLSHLEGAKIYFDIVDGRNVAIRKFNKKFPFREFKKIGFVRKNASVYSTYNKIVLLMAQHLKVSGIEVEMMLFANADHLVLSDTDAQALLSRHYNYQQDKKRAQIAAATERLRQQGFMLS